MLQKSQREVKWSRDFEASGLIADHLWSIRCWFNWRREKYYYYYYSYLNVADVPTSSHSSNRSFGVEFCHLLSKLKRWQHRWWRGGVFFCVSYITDLCISINLTCLFAIHLICLLWLSCLILYTLPGPLTSKLLHHKRSVQSWLAVRSCGGGSPPVHAAQTKSLLEEAAATAGTLFKFK